MHCHIQFKKDFTIIKKNGEKLVSNFFIINIQYEAYAYLSQKYTLYKIKVLLE